MAQGFYDDLVLSDEDDEDEDEGSAYDTGNLLPYVNEGEYWVIWSDDEYQTEAPKEDIEAL